MNLFSYLTRYAGRIRHPNTDLNYDFNEARENYLSRVKDQGLVVVTPQDNQLQIDIDNQQQYEAFLYAMKVVTSNWDDSYLIDIEDHPSKSGLPSRHITVTLPFKVDPWQRIALQAALGSDPIRELLSATRLFRNEPNPTMFVELKQASLEGMNHDQSN